MKTKLLAFAALAAANAFAVSSPKYKNGEFLGNPLLDHQFCADPTSVEYEGRLYVYGSNDHQEYDESLTKTNNTYVHIKTLVVMSTADMVNWTYHGTVPAVELQPFASTSWAPSIVSRKEADGKTHFYLYYASNGSATSVLTATHPLGPWTSPIDKQLVRADYSFVKTKGICCFDPGAAIAPDGTGYLTFGGGGGHIVKLGPDMISVASDSVKMPAPFHFEANELNFIGDTCVYTYNIDWSQHEPWPCDCPKPIGCSMVYETSKTPMDPASWKMKGDYNRNPGDFGMMYCNNHTHLHKFKNKWYLLYHNQELQKDLLGRTPGYRNICVDVCDVDEKNVTFGQVKNTMKGVEQIEKLNPRKKVQGETAAATASMKFNSFSSQPGNLTVSPKEDGAWVAVRGADFGKKAPAKFTAFARGKGRIEVRLDKPDGKLVAAGKVESGDFAKSVFRAKEPVIGEHSVFVVLFGTSELDWWIFE